MKQLTKEQLRQRQLLILKNMRAGMGVFAAARLVNKQPQPPKEAK